MALCVTAFTQNASDFTVDANGVITKYTGFDTVVLIPATIGGKRITAIGDEAFRKADITSVTIPQGVTSIGKAAFLDNKLTIVTIPNSVTSIGESAFANNRLARVTIPGSVKTIQRNAFRGNTSLVTIDISEGVENIYSGAFADTKCVNVSLPSTLSSIYGDAFDKSGNPAFALAANIKADFDSIPAFYSYIANDRKAGTYYSNLPLTRKKADDYEYYETRYGAVLIKYTGDSTRVRVPATIGGVAVKALYGTPDILEYSFDGIFRLKRLAAVQIPEGITYIGKYTFTGLDKYTSDRNLRSELANITIPDSVTYIGERAFSCGNLTTVTIGTGVMYIGYGAFEDNLLTSVTIGTGVTYIGVSAFSSNRLTSITIGNNVELDSLYSSSNRTTYGAFGYANATNGFDKFYNDNKKAAGTYTYANDSWRKQ